MNNEYVVEDGIPIPDARPGRPKGSGLRGLLCRMDVGQSVFLPGRSQDYATSTVSGAKKASGFTYSIRKVEGGHRVWRVK